MQEITFDNLVREIAFESFGVPIGIRVEDPELWPRVTELIPPHSRRFDADEVEHHFSLISNEDGTYTLRYDIRDGVKARLVDVWSYIASDVDLPLALGLLDSYLHSCVGLYARDRIFIHAGAVGYRNRMVVIPGPALVGKSTLVAALLRAGATYYSDRFAVLDPEGRVHPYAAPLHLPGAAPAGADGDRAESAGAEPLSLGAIVLTYYRPGAEWRPAPVSEGQGVLALVSFTVPAHDRQEESMRVIHRAVEANPVVLESDRDEADVVASALLADLDRRFSGSS